MEPKDRQYTSAHEDERNLKAAVAARRELGPEYEDQVLETFLGRIQESIDDRVSRGLALRRDSGANREASGDAEESSAAGSSYPGGSGRSARAMKGEPVDIRLVGGTFALAIPLLAIASDVAQSLGVLLVLLAVVAVNLLYFIDRWVRMG